MSNGSIEAFIKQISTPLFEGMFNPWRQTCETEIESDGYLARRERLRRHLDCPDPKILLIGEAPGYQGCRYSGVAFTSERLLLEGAIPRMPDLQGQRITDRNVPWSEPSATIVWGILYDLGITENTVMFNAVPWHPEGRKGIHSNRAPTTAEKNYGLEFLEIFLGLYPGVPVVALGKIASGGLSTMEVEHHKVRHPAYGGAGEFRNGMKERMLIGYV